MNEADAEVELRNLVVAVENELKETTVATLVEVQAPAFHETMAEADAEKTIQEVIDKVEKELSQPTPTPATQVDFHDEVVVSVDLKDLKPVTETTSGEEEAAAAAEASTTHRTINYEEHITTFGYVVDKILQEVDRGFDGKDHHVDNIEDALSNIAGHFFDDVTQTTTTTQAGDVYTTLSELTEEVDTTPSQQLEVDEEILPEPTLGITEQPPLTTQATTTTTEPTTTSPSTTAAPTTVEVSKYFDDCLCFK